MLPFPNHVITGERAGRSDDKNFLPLHRETNKNVVLSLFCFVKGIKSWAMYIYL